MALLRAILGPERSDAERAQALARFARALRIVTREVASEGPWPESICPQRMELRECRWLLRRRVVRRQPALPEAVERLRLRGAARR